MKILLIRHAEPDYFSKAALTPKGFREADMLADRLEKQGVDEIYSSPIPRAMKTAKPLADALGKKIKILPWAEEFRGKIILEGTGETIPWNLPNEVWSGEEEFYDIHNWLKNKTMSSVDVPAVYENVCANLDSLLESYGYTSLGDTLYSAPNNGEKTIAIFCHFGVGMVMSSHLTGISPVLLWQSMFLPASSVTTFITEEREKGIAKFKCMQMGDTSHLMEHGEPVSHSGLFSEVYDELSPATGPQV